MNCHFGIFLKKVAPKLSQAQLLRLTGCGQADKPRLPQLLQLFTLEHLPIVCLSDGFF